MRRHLYNLLVSTVMFVFIIGGIYLCVWHMLVGGIVDIINQVKAPSTDGEKVAIGILKIIFCEIPLVLGIFLSSIVSSAYISKPRNFYSRNWR